MQAVADVMRREYQAIVDEATSIAPSSSQTCCSMMRWRLGSKATSAPAGNSTSTMRTGEPVPAGATSRRT